MMTKVDGILGGIPPLQPLPGEIERALLPPNSAGTPPVGQPNTPQDEQWQLQLPKSGVWERGGTDPAPRHAPASPAGPGLDQAYSLDLGHTDDELAAFLAHTYDMTGKKPRGALSKPGRPPYLPGQSGTLEADKRQLQADIRFLLTGERARQSPEREETGHPPAEPFLTEPYQETISREEVLQIAVRLHRQFHACEDPASRELPRIDYMAYAAKEGMLAQPVLDFPKEAATRSWTASMFASALPAYELTPLAPAHLPESLGGCRYHDSLLRLFQAGVWAVPARCRPDWPEEPVSRREVAAVVGRILIPSDRVFPQTGEQEAGLEQK